MNSELGMFQFVIWDSSDLGFGIADFGFKSKAHGA